MENLNSYLTFRIGHEYFAANAGYVQNIIEIPKITQLPEMPKYMLGVINHRGKVLPVIDARIKIGIPQTELTTNSCIIVVEVSIDGKQVFVGILVDSVDEVIEFGEKEIKEAPAIGRQINSGFIIGVYEYKEKFLLILDMNSMIANNEELKFEGALS